MSLDVGHFQDFIGLLAARGAIVHVSDILDCGDTVATIENAGGKAFAHNLDVTDREGCAALGPEVSPGARFVTSGSYAVCVDGLLGTEVFEYTLTVAADDGTIGFPSDEAEDPDADDE